MAAVLLACGRNGGGPDAGPVIDEQPDGGEWCAENAPCACTLTCPAGEVATRLYYCNAPCSSGIDHMIKRCCPIRYSPSDAGVVANACNKWPECNGSGCDPNVTAIWNTNGQGAIGCQ